MNSKKHLPLHTQQYHHRDEIEANIPPEAMKVINQGWPEVEKTFTQWDTHSGMLMLYRLTRDAMIAAKWPESAAYLIRDYLLSRVNAAKLREPSLEPIHFKPTSESIVGSLLEMDELIRVKNRHNGREYMARTQYWPEHGFNVQILDLGPEVWGRGLHGEDAGPVIDQGWVLELEERGWEFPPLTKPTDVRQQMLQKLAASFRPKPEQGELFTGESMNIEENNWIKGAIKHPGRCTPMSKPGCTGHAKALAKRFKKGGDIHADNEHKHESAQLIVRHMLDEDVMDGSPDDEGVRARIAKFMRDGFDPNTARKLATNNHQYIARNPSRPSMMANAGAGVHASAMESRKPREKKSEDHCGICGSKRHKSDDCPRKGMPH